MPGVMVAVELPLQLNAPWLVKPVPSGGLSEASGSASGATPVIGVGEKMALPLMPYPPTALMVDASTSMLLLPLPVSAVEQLELTCMPPLLAVIIPFPESATAPHFVGLSAR